MDNFARNMTALSLVPILLVINAQAGAQDRERPSFADFDANEDGKLSLEEFSKIGSRRGTSEEMFERLDANDDGYITEDEFQSRQRGSRRGT